MKLKNQATHSDLDALLEPLSRDHETFAAKARELACAWNAADIALELRGPETWRNPLRYPRSGVATIEEQLRSEIDSIQLMDREEEARHARRIEFARMRLEVALEEEGLDEDDLEGSVCYEPDTFRDVEPQRCLIPPSVCRRWVELHALRTELVERNLYLVLINVERYAHLGSSRLDLVQEGSASLFRAADGFDWRRELLFRTYAVHWLNQAFRSFLYNNGQTVRVPVYLQKAMKHVRAAKTKLGGDGLATPEGIAEETGLEVHLVESALDAMKSTLSMDMPLNGEQGTGLADVIGTDNPEGLYVPEMEEFSITDGIEMAFDRLSDRERFVVEMRFGVNQGREHTLAEVAKKLGVSLERVRQIQVRALGKMKTPALRKAVDPFLQS
jgi:RNA polymerase sigma factor (sigma-70 family)